MPTPPERAEHANSESLLQLLGGARPAIEATIPPVVFVLAWMLSGNDIVIGGAAATLSGLIIAGFALYQRRRLTSVIFGLLAVVASAAVAVYTGNAVDFFLLRLLSNAASMLAWIASIMVRWPFLGIVLGALLGTKTTWRKDPVILRAYNRASWFWVAQYGVRVIVLGYFWATGHVIGLSVAHILLSYPLFALSLIASGWALFGSIPKTHPGIRHPQVAHPGQTAEQNTEQSEPRNSNHTGPETEA
ncbi:DUF3159 domain-containing protein [Pseudoglutamicibacter albus]|uniref:DUF3159 domain-containing protein n=1 Tax=Pseudoglutamicibacter albus TaxID=98671 RepID=UPI001EF62508|nr:DUF3159 domain-containing protein [Pseudoglutamicibacter albus]MCG7303760.1 DUF3159 domain-containing protein [Pseudoglutamicibacter albus]